MNESRIQAIVNEKHASDDQEIKKEVQEFGRYIIIENMQQGFYTKNWSFKGFINLFAKTKAQQQQRKREVKDESWFGVGEKVKKILNITTCDNEQNEVARKGKRRTVVTTQN